MAKNLQLVIQELKTPEKLAEFLLSIKVKIV